MAPIDVRTTRRRRRVSVYACAAACASLLACASSSGTTSRHSSRDVILREELFRASASNAYDAVERLRPQFLRTRGRASITAQGTESRGVLLDDRPFGTVAQLREIDLSQIEEIRFLSAAEAQQKYGMGYVGGAIVVTTIHHSRR